MSWEVVSCWIEGHPGLASWVQAVGSIAAIFAAIWIAHRDSLLRKKEEAELKNGAVVRAITVVNDAKTRVDAAIDAINNFGANPVLTATLKADLNESQQYLKEALSSPGVDSAVYTQLFLSIKAVENVIHILPVIGKDDVLEEGEADPVQELQKSMGSALNMLTSMQKSKRPIICRIFQRNG